MIGVGMRHILVYWVGIFIAFYIYFLFKGVDLSLNITILLFPLMVVLMGVLGLGLGMIISSLVTKYRDFIYLVGFGVQLLMYLSAVVYPMSLIDKKMPEYAWIVAYNPLAYIVESTRFVLLGVGAISIFGLVYTAVLAVFILFFGLLVFNKTEKNFIDTV